MQRSLHWYRTKLTSFDSDTSGALAKRGVGNGASASPDLDAILASRNVATIRQHVARHARVTVELISSGTSLEIAIVFVPIPAILPRCLSRTLLVRPTDMPL